MIIEDLLSLMQKLHGLIEVSCLPQFPRHSRIHRLRSFPGTCYVKREDELGFGISGTKLRKYLSLLPDILQKAPKEAIITGSAYSNHVLSCAQLLREYGIEPILFLLGDSTCKCQGNLLYSTMIAEPKNIHWIERSKWHEIDQIAEAYAQERIGTVIIPKGANCKEALPGALTLALDILRNEQEAGITFDHLFIDSGTGMTACSLLLAFAYLKKNTFLHIVQVAGNREEFLNNLEARKHDFEQLLGEKLPFPEHFKSYTPSIAPSFGSVNATLFQTIAEVARSEGFLTDPVYTAKLFYEGKKILSEQCLKGHVLFLHSGGALGLTGFQDNMAKVLFR